MPFKHFKPVSGVFRLEDKDGNAVIFRTYDPSMTFGIIRSSCLWAPEKTQIELSFIEEGNSPTWELAPSAAFSSPVPKEVSTQEFLKLLGD